MKYSQSRLWYGGLALISALTAFNVFWHLEHAERSAYYSMVAVSMSQSWHNAFFGAIDPAGLISLDKIPGSYWIPALLVHFFGFHNSAVVAPNGLATLVAVILLAYTGKRLGGVWAGLLSGLLFACTPVIVAVARSNEPESAFLLSMAAVALIATEALQRQSRVWLVIAGLAIAAGFHQYMILAWTVWPALAAAWWFGTSGSRAKRLLDLMVAGASSVAASLVWIIAVWLTPASSRPFISNTLKNNPWEMVFGYNALGRFGNTKHMAGQTGAFKTFTPPFSGHPAVFRLFYHQVIGQISWLIPATIIAIAYLWLRGRHRPHLIFFSVSFATHAVIFSLVAGMHQYYTAILAIPMAALTAVAVYEAFVDREFLWLAGLSVATAGLAIVAGRLNPGYLKYLPLAQALLAAVVVACAVVVIRKSSKTKAATTGKAWLRIFAVTLTGSILLTPLGWSLDARNHPSFVNPMAGPPDSYTVTLAHKSGGVSKVVTKKIVVTGSTQKTKISHPAVLKWLETRPHGKYLLTTFGADAAAPYVVIQPHLRKHLAIVPIGGFNGSDPVPSLSQFKKMVALHRINYVLMNHFIGDSAGYAGWESARIKHWVAANCHKNENPPSSITIFYCWAR
jgi:4-amino-4-deoxy-L-arabinose transferase-like glycosyltransferase